MKKNLNIFFYSRIGIILFAGYVSVCKIMEQEKFIKSYSVPHLECNDLFLIFIFSIFGFLILTYFQSLNPRYKNGWRKPSWNNNPFSLNNPIDFFHFAGFLLLASGIANISANYFKFKQINIEGLVFLVSGIGVYVGVKLTEIIYKEKFSNQKRRNKGDGSI